MENPTNNTALADLLNKATGIREIDKMMKRLKNKKIISIISALFPYKSYIPCIRHQSRNPCGNVLA